MKRKRNKKRYAILFPAVYIIAECKKIYSIGADKRKYVSYEVNSRGPVKFGYSHAPQKRMEKELQPGNPRKLKIVAIRKVPDTEFGLAIEKCIIDILWNKKSLFKQKGPTKNEWFNITVKQAIKVLEDFPKYSSKFLNILGVKKRYDILEASLYKDSDDLKFGQRDIFWELSDLITGHSNEFDWEWDFSFHNFYRY